MVELERTQGKISAGKKQQSFREHWGPYLPWEHPPISRGLETESKRTTKAEKDKKLVA